MRRLLPLLLLVALVEPAAAATPTCTGSAPHLVRVGKAVTITVDCWDVEEDAFRIDLGPVVNGTASLLGNVITYVPAEDGPGSVGFSATEVEQNVTGTPAAVDFDVTVNHPPVCATATPHAASTVVVALGCSDQDVQDDVLAYALTELPQHGSVTLDGGTATYTAASGYTGSDGFAFTVTDGTATTVVRRRVHLGPGTVCDPSVPAPSVRPGRSVTFTLDCTTTSGPVANVAVLSGPDKGAVTVAGRRATYRAFHGQTGADAFTFGDGTTQPLVIDGARNDPPLCTRTPVIARAGDVLTWTPACTDPEGDAITLELVSGPARGVAATVEGSRGRPALSYLAPRAYSGADALRVRAIDARGASSAPVRVAITVRERLRPACNTPSPATAVAIAITCADFLPLAGDSFRLGRAPQRGTVTVNPNGVTYFGSGPDAFTVVATNDAGATTVPITIGTARKLKTPAARRAVAPDLPGCTPPAPVRVRPGRTVTLPAIVCDGRAVHTRVLGQPALGTVSPAFELDAAAERRYTAGLVEGTDTVVYGVRAGGLAGPPVTQTVTIEAGANQPPRCTPGQAAQQSALIATSCTDPDGDPLTYAVVQAPFHGTLSVLGSRVVYTPTPDYTGPDTFVLDAIDDHGAAARLVQYRVLTSPRASIKGPGPLIDRGVCSKAPYGDTRSTQACEVEVARGVERHLPSLTCQLATARQPSRNFRTVAAFSASLTETPPAVSRPPSTTGFESPPITRPPATPSSEKPRMSDCTAFGACQATHGRRRKVEGETIRDLIADSTSC